MKKTKFFIAVYNSETHAQDAQQVEGYFEFVAGLPLGFHKSDGAWTCSELSTGCAITYGRTRAEALEKARPYFDRVCKLILDEKMQPVRRMITAAYNGGAA